MVSLYEARQNNMPSAALWAALAIPVIWLVLLCGGTIAPGRTAAKWFDALSDRGCGQVVSTVFRTLVCGSGVNEVNQQCRRPPPALSEVRKMGSCNKRPSVKGANMKKPNLATMPPEVAKAIEEMIAEPGAYAAPREQQNRG